GNSGSNIELEEVQEPQVIREPEKIENVRPIITQAPRRSQRESRPPERYSYLLENDLEVHLTEDDDPSTYKEAMYDIDSEKWHKAMKSEMESMHANQVWTLVDPPEGIVPIGCKWVYKRKRGSDGQVETYKVRLVAKGYTQKQGVDYEETFSPVAML